MRSSTILHVPFTIHSPLWPNLTETWRWSTQILNEVTCALLFYALSGWLFVAHVRRGGAWRLTGSALAYGIGLLPYEQGILLPAAASRSIFSRSVQCNYTPRDFAR
ncbi:MAG: hypothetical protein KKC51_15380 [Verrucomicrobia bacterium]|nr:hypothetical protein [Verrucomicrobiota bacterium]